MAENSENVTNAQLMQMLQRVITDHQTGHGTQSLDIGKLRKAVTSSMLGFTAEKMSKAHDFRQWRASLHTLTLEFPLLGKYLEDSKLPSDTVSDEFNRADDDLFLASLKLCCSGYAREILVTAATDNGLSGRAALRLLEEHCLPRTLGDRYKQATSLAHDLPVPIPARQDPSRALTAYMRAVNDHRRLYQDDVPAVLQVGTLILSLPDAYNDLKLKLLDQSWDTEMTLKTLSDQVIAFWASHLSPTTNGGGRNRADQDATALVVNRRHTGNSYGNGNGNGYAGRSNGGQPWPSRNANRHGGGNGRHGNTYAGPNNGGGPRSQVRSPRKDNAGKTQLLRAQAKQSSHERAVRSEDSKRCYICKQIGHVAIQCPERNHAREPSRVAAPAIRDREPADGFATLTAHRAHEQAPDRVPSQNAVQLELDSVHPRTPWHRSKNSKNWPMWYWQHVHSTVECQRASQARAAGMPPPLDCCGRYTIHAADCPNVWTQVSLVTSGRKAQMRLNGYGRRDVPQELLYSRPAAPTQESLLLGVLKDEQRAQAQKTNELEMKLTEEAAQLTRSIADLAKVIQEKTDAAVQCCKSLKQRNAKLEVRVTALTREMEKRRKRPASASDATIATDGDDDALVGDLAPILSIGDLDPAAVAEPSNKPKHPRVSVLQDSDSGTPTRISYADAVKFGKKQEKFASKIPDGEFSPLRAAGLAAGTYAAKSPSTYLGAEKVSQHRPTTGLVAPGARPWWPVGPMKSRERDVRANPVRLKGFTSRVLRGALLRVNSPSAARPCALAAHLVRSPGNRTEQRTPLAACVVAATARVPVPTVLDSGANACLFKDEDHFVALDKTQRSKWTVADGDVKLASSGVGTVHYSVWNDVSNEPLQLVLPNVCWCPTASYNLISVSTLEDLHDIYCDFVDRVASTPGGDVQIRIKRINGMYCLDEPAPL